MPTIMRPPRRLPKILCMCKILPETDIRRWAYRMQLVLASHQSLPVCKQGPESAQMFALTLGTAAAVGNRALKYHFRREENQKICCSSPSPCNYAQKRGLHASSPCWKIRVPPRVFFVLSLSHSLYNEDLEKCFLNQHFRCADGAEFHWLCCCALLWARRRSSLAADIEAGAPRAEP